MPTSAPVFTDHQNKSSSWWETYVIRYFVGTVVGGAILLFLNASESSSLKGALLPGIKDLKSLDVGMLTVLAVVGFAFCYIASAPILVLHASRAAQLFPYGKFTSRFFIFFGTAILCISLSLLMWSAVDPILISSGSIFSIVLLLQIVPLIRSMRKDAQISHQFYEKLADARADLELNRQEYMESYRHLREHGNAFFILLCEGALGIVLIGLPNAGYALICLLLWTLPAAGVWVLGTQLEARYTNG